MHKLVKPKLRYFCLAISFDVDISIVNNIARLNLHRRMRRQIKASLPSNILLTYIDTHILSESGGNDPGAKKIWEHSLKPYFSSDWLCL